MFEELCRKVGILKVPNGVYTDGKETYTSHPNQPYFECEESERGETGLSVRTVYYVRDTFGSCPAGSEFVTEEGKRIRVRVAERLYNHFGDTPEFWRIEAES